MIKEPRNFNDVLKLQAILDSNINNIRERTLEDIKLSLIAEIIEFNEETEHSHKTWKTKEINKEAQLEELTDVWFFAAQLVNYYENERNLTLLEIDNLNEVFANNDGYVYVDVLTIIFELRFLRFNWLKFFIKKLIALTNEYGYTTNDILKCYWKKWQKNMQRIGKEWN
ncbi:MAG: dUTP diphosphatase [Fusobacterium gastrosuis]|uniref:dUTP diphosphatase n=1 Tax=Fusobacterium gastrosuis TaxID=1755100 RepID=UPI002A8EF48A|nr:dUTP diphosphatase [Fusobacterium gastrosuis]